MSQQLAIETIQQMLMMTLWLTLPLLAVVFVVGIIVSFLQILTSIQDPSFGAVPRLAAFCVTFLVALPWLVTRMVAYTERLWGDLAKYAH
jgi:flagellar biosynthesis protein FliQ